MIINKNRFEKMTFSSHYPLILEGGAMRGVFAAGVLDVFLEKNLNFDRVVGTSAGAIQAVCYLSKQPGRNIRINMTYCNDPRYMGWSHFFTKRNYFNFDFIFDEIAYHLDPMDWQSLEKTKTTLYAVVTDVLSGEGKFLVLNPRERVKFLQILKASASIPIMSTAVNIDGISCVDGGVGFPCVPLLNELPFHADKAIYILTREKTYRKNQISSLLKTWLPKISIEKYKALAKAITMMSDVYNQKIEKLSALEDEGKIFILRPDEKVEVSRAEKNPEKLQDLYNKGKQIGNERWDELMRWIDE